MRSSNTLIQKKLAPSTPPAETVSDEKETEIIDGFKISFELALHARATFVRADEIGSGSFATTYKVKYFGDEVAVKNLTNFSSSSIKSFREESAKLKAINAMSIPSVVRFIGYHEDVLNQRYQIIMEYVEGKTLEIIASPYYTNNEVSECVSSLIPIPLLTAAEILMSVTEACIPLEEKGIAHCDLSPKNLILNKEGKVRLVDLAFAVMVGEKSFVKLKVCRGCSPYQAPEISSHYQYNLKTDVYAMGSIASIFANEGEPFGKDDQLSCDEILRKVVSGERHRLSLFCNPSLKEAINLCWMAKPEDRPTMKALNKSFGELLAVEKRSLNANK